MSTRFRALLAALTSLAVIASIAASAAAFPNGQARPSDLSPVYGSTNSRGKPQAAYLRKGTVAASWNTLNLCASAAGVPLSPGASSYSPAATAYRTYAVQVILRRQLGGNAAIPGHSNHGLALAIDLRDPPHMRPWLDRNGARFGWDKRTSDAPWENWHISAAGVAFTFHRPDPGASFRFPNLRKGSGGPCQAPAVREVQRRVGVTQDGDYGSGTARAVRVFQREHHMHVDGRVGSKTWLRLRKAGRKLENGHDPRNVGNLPGQVAPVAGQDVRAVQGLLNARFGELDRPQYRIKVTGQTSPAFTKAVRRFQVLANRRGAHLKVTGIVNDATYAALLKSYAPSLVGKRFGPDLSGNNGGPLDFAAMKQAGMSFVVLKEGEGADFVDKSFAARVKAAQAARFEFGTHVYHYLHPRAGRAGSVEADFALRTSLHDGWKPKQGVLWADLETNHGLAPSGVCAYVESFEDYLVAKHIKTGVYTYPGFAHQYLSGCPKVTARASWRAHYGVKVPDPFPWRGTPPLWQLTDHYTVKGSPSKVDLSTGSAQDLYRLVR
jgi:peptidoglycan hydrolase-like protein with peptidoglycan-binding domain